MTINTKKYDHNLVFPLVQWYGECLEHLRQVLHKEDKIIKAKVFEQTQIEMLHMYKQQRLFMEVELGNLTGGLYEEYGFRSPNINGWRITKGHNLSKSRSVFTPMSTKSTYHNRTLYPSLVTDAFLERIGPPNCSCNPIGDE